MRRRAFLASCLAGGLAGCLGDGSPVETPDEETATATPDGTPAASGVDGSGGSTAAGTRSPAATPSSTGGSSPTRSARTETPALFPGYETTEVRVTTPDGDTLGSVTAAIADTPDLRYTGLSDTASLPADRGMLFVYGSPGDHTYVMRRMDFGIDIVYADAEGAITRIHHAPEPGPNEDGEDQEYPGYGQYVLELAYEWTTERGVETGDVLQFDL